MKYKQAVWQTKQFKKDHGRVTLL